jgi:hypothetical protein
MPLDPILAILESIFSAKTKTNAKWFQPVNQDPRGDCFMKKSSVENLVALTIDKQELHHIGGAVATSGSGFASDGLTQTLASKIC